MAKEKRLMAAFFLVLGANAHGAVPETPETVRRLLDAGAAELALTRTVAAQPGSPDGARWADWEAVRCEALARLGRGDALLERVNRLQGASTSAALKRCYIEAAAAAITAQQPKAAREYAARALWQWSPSADEVRTLRLAVIRSYVLEQRRDEAFRSMLRYQQDYQPLDRAIARRFADALIDLGLAREAVNWAGEEGSPPRLRLQMRGGLLTAENAFRRARAALQRTSDRTYAQVMIDAAARQQNSAWEAEALEQLLQLTPEDASDTARRLWQSYQTTAGEIGNRERLLVGDDGAWADYAARRLGSEPILSRAFYGYLAQRAQNRDIRGNAQLQLAASLRASGLDLAAVRLFMNSGAPIETLDAQTRYVLGATALARGEAALAARLWSNIGAPAQVNAQEWELMRARAALRASDADASIAAVQRSLAERPTLSADAIQQALELGQDLLERGKPASAQTIYELLLARATDTRMREVLLGLARAHELQGDAVSAADAYLRAALASDGRQADAVALQARMQAAANLVRAGYRADARALLEWITRNTKDTALLEAARRELKRL